MGFCQILSYLEVGPSFWETLYAAGSPPHHTPLFLASPRRQRILVSAEEPILSILSELLFIKLSVPL